MIGNAVFGSSGDPTRRSAAVLAFPPGGRARATPGVDGPRGEILLFTGVRYERPVHDERPAGHDEPLQPVPPAGAAPRRRRRS
jgi:hypothetical protein